MATKKEFRVLSLPNGAVQYVDTNGNTHVQPWGLRRTTIGDIILTIGCTDQPMKWWVVPANMRKTLMQAECISLTDIDENDMTMEFIAALNGDDRAEMHKALDKMIDMYERQTRQGREDLDKFCAFFIKFVDSQLRVIDSSWADEEKKALAKQRAKSAGKKAAAQR